VERKEKKYYKRVFVSVGRWRNSKRRNWVA
jgi:hypothetical protein